MKLLLLKLIKSAGVKWATMAILKWLVKQTKWKVDDCFLTLIEVYLEEDRGPEQLQRQVEALLDSIKGHYGH